MPDIYNMSDVFISYSRKDSEFAKKLFTDIKGTGKEVWADFEDIPKAADWWEEIKAGINAADAFIFVISPDSVQSDICRQEIDHAVEMNKRFLPLLHREIVEDEDKAKVHPSVSSHNWIFFREGDDYEDSFKILMESVETDLVHNRTLTRLLVRAKEWNDNDKESSYLLQGEDLDQAEAWLATGMNKVPAPTNLHAEYIKSSNDAEMKQQRRLLTFVSIGLVISVLLAIFAAFQTVQAFKAREQAEIARDQADVARDQAETAQEIARSSGLSASANEALANSNPDLALSLSLVAVENTDFSQNDTSHQRVQQMVLTSLADAAYAPSTRARVGTDEIANAVVYAGDGSIFATGFFDGNICIYNGNAGTQIECLSHGEGEAAHNNSVLWLHMSDDGTRLLSSGDDGRLILWELTNEPFSYSIIAELEIEGLTASVLASDATFALYGTDAGDLIYWDFTDEQIAFNGYFTGEAPAASSEITVLALSNDNSLALAGLGENAITVWDIEYKEATNYFFNPNNDATRIMALAFNHDNTVIVSGDRSGGISIWNYELPEFSIIRAYQGHDSAVTGIQFSENGRSMFTSSWDNSIIEWDINTGRAIQSFYGHTGGINALSLTADNRGMVSGSFDSSLRIWHVRPAIQEINTPILTNDENIRHADWDGEHIVTTQAGGNILVFEERRNQGSPPQASQWELTHTFENDVRGISIALHPDHLRFTALSQEEDTSFCRLGFYTVEGVELWEIDIPIEDEDTIECHQVLFHPQDEKILVVRDEDLLWFNFEGESLGSLPYNPEHNPKIRVVALTLDGTGLLIGENRRDEMLRLIDVETGETIRIYNEGGHNDGVLAIDMSPDGTQFITGSFDNTIVLWNIDQSNPQATMEGHSERILSVAFSPEGDSVVSASNDRTMRLWDLRTGFTWYTYHGHTERLIMVEFSEDGRSILTASYDSTLIIWKKPQHREELLRWIDEARYVHELSCTEQKLYQITPNASCAEE